MAEQEIRSSAEDGEHPEENAPYLAMDMGEDGGVEGEIEEEGEELSEDKRHAGKGSRSMGQSPTTIRDAVDKGGGGESRKHRSSSDRRRHHHHHHSSSHRDHRRRRSGGHTSDADGDVHGSEEDVHSSSGRSRRRSESFGESHSDHSSVADKSSHSSPRKHHDRRSSYSSTNLDRPHQQQSRHSLEESSDNGEWSESHEDPLGHPRDSMYVSRSRHSKEKRESHKNPMGSVAEKGEAEDGEILEDGELDDDEEEVESKGGEETIKESSTEVSPSKSSSREEMKGEKSEKSERKKSDKDRRKKDSEDKRKRKKYTDMDNMEEESGPAPAWGSGYQGPKPKAASFRGKQQTRFGRGSKGYQSPPGLYDSPSYSEDSEEEIPKALVTEGYIDASVAADEKEGIFNQKTILPKKKKRERIMYERNDRKRGRLPDGKFDGPIKKKPLLDLAMSERPVCKFYMEGKCAKGSGCQFNHDVEKPKRMEVCKYHLTVKGCHKEKCLYMHQDFPCKYYHTGAKCYSGDRCKFSHDPLTEDTRRALEMRVAAEDIINMDDPEYDYDYRPRGERDYDSRARPSLLGSPPRYRPDVKKIPSLFDIEVHPPGQSPKPSPQSQRPSGFYNETNVSPKPGMANSGLMNSPNVGMMGNQGPMNQHQQGMGNNQGPNMGGPGLLQAPMRGPGPNMMGPMGNRPSMMGNQQGMNPQQQRPGGGPPVQFMGPNQMNNNQQQQQPQQQGGNLRPVLNMLGAIIREAAMQKGPGGPSNNNNNSMNMGPNNMGPNNMGPNNMGPNNMGPNNMGPGGMGMGPNNVRPNMNSMGTNMNMGPNNMQQGNMNAVGPNNNMGPNSNMTPNSMGNIVPNSMGSMGPNSMGNMPPNTMNNMGPVSMGQNMMGPNNSMGNMGPPNSMGNMGPNSNMGGMMGSGNNMGMGQPNMGQEVGIMDVDYRIKRDYEEMEEASQDLTELDKIRRQIQEQIDKEDEDEEEGEEEADEDGKMQIKEDVSPERSRGSPDPKDEKAALRAEVEAELEHLEIPAHLPKKQRELFKRIQQQQLLREKERERQEALKAAEEAEAKAEVDDWYSSDEDGEGENKPKLTDVLKKLNQETSASKLESSPSLSSSSVSGSISTSSLSSTTTPSTASTFDIMQMINAIKNQSTASTATSTSTLPAMDSAASIQASTKLSSSISSDPRQQKFLHSSVPESPQSPPPVKKQLPLMPNLPTLTVDPPVVSARPMKPLVYSVVKISLPTAKPYTELPNDVNASDPAFRSDPRVRWHLQYLEKQMAKEQQRRNSSEAEKPQKPADPRLKKASSGDPRLAKAGDSPGSGQGDGSRVSDPRLQRGQAQSRPSDPRLARQAGGNLDPRLNRQTSQDNSSFMGGPINNMGGGPMNNMPGMMNNQMGGPMGNMGGPMNNQMGGAMNNPMAGGGMNNPMGGAMNNMGPMGNMGGPMNSQMGGPMNSQMGGPMNQMGGGMNAMGGGRGRQMQGGGPMNNMGPMGNNMNMMGGAMNNMGGGINQMGGPGGLMGPGPSQMNRMGGPQGPPGNMGGPGNNSLMAAGAMGGMMRGPMGQQNTMGSESGMLDPRMNNPADPRMGGQRTANDPRSGSDPRLRNKSMDPREQRLSSDMRQSMRDPRSVSTISSPNDDGLNDPRSYDNGSDSNAFQSHLRGQNDFRQSQNEDMAAFSGSGKFKMSQGRDEWSQDPVLHRNEPGDISPPSVSTIRSPSTQDSENEGQKATRKFDHRNDPRFKRVKRLAGQRKGTMEYSSPLGGEDGQGGSDDGGDSGYNSYSRPKPPTRDPRARNTPSPSLPDTLQDFELPALPPLTVSEPEPDLKVKDLFKTIDPTASPFC